MKESDLSGLASVDLKLVSHMDMSIACCLLICAIALLIFTLLVHGKQCASPSFNPEIVHLVKLKFILLLKFKVTVLELELIAVICSPQD